MMTNREALLTALDAFPDPARREKYLDLYSSDAMLYGYDGVEPGREGIRKFYEAFWAAFPDARVNPQEIIESGDRLIVRFELTATHNGPFLGLAATGKPIRLHGITILRFEGGQCKERWSAADFLPVLVQIGAFPPPPPR